MAEKRKSYESTYRDERVARIVKELHAARLMQGLGITELARRTKVSRQSLAAWEAGTSQPHLAPLSAWARGLGYRLRIDIE